jgi:integrase
MRLYEHPNGKARLYLQTTSKKIYMEFYDENEKRCQISSKTEDLEEAKRKLEERLIVVKLTKSGDLFLDKKKSKKVEILCDEVIKDLELKKNEKNLTETIRHLIKIKNKIGKIEIAKLKTDDLKIIYNESLSITMNANYKKAFNLLFKKAFDAELITKIIELPSSNLKENEERKVYEKEKVDEIILLIHEKTVNSKNKKTRLYGMLINKLIYFLQATGLRYGEALNLKGYNVKSEMEVFDDVIINIEKSKTIKRRISITKRIMNILQSVIHYKSKDFDISVSSRDLIFGGFENKEIDFSGFLKELRNRYKKEFEEIEAEEFTLYSLRHSFIRRKLREKMAAIDIASHCGTSVKMIEKYYNKGETPEVTRIYTGKD